jgi:apolipoprotein D and lipocalin family protein
MQTAKTARMWAPGMKERWLGHASVRAMATAMVVSGMAALACAAHAEEQMARPEANAEVKTEFKAEPKPEGTLPALKSLAQIDVQRYMGLWYQVALFPNRFQAQCVSDTTATYRLLPSGAVEVLNRCRTASGKMDDALGQARPVGELVGGQLKPAQLQVSFLPSWLRWTGVGWGDYWVIQLASDYRYAVVSEPSRRFLWVLSRSLRLSAQDEAAIRAALQAQGFDLAKLENHPQG